LELLPRKVKIVCYTPLLTWGGRTFTKEGEEEEQSNAPGPEEETEEKPDEEKSELKGRRKKRMKKRNQKLL
jgi:hypothetical protein